ncbi:hypothetical protein BT69DRAFT_1305505 [Atractiella rhizophila]|nr:hypothetical protein BT69DRAFT_1305505 [Atractiella rhizophila]
MAVKYWFMQWKKDEWLNLGLPLPPSRRSWSDLLRAIESHPGRTKVQIHNLPWSDVDLKHMLESTPSYKLGSLKLFFRKRQAELSLQEILHVLMRKVECNTITGLIPSPAQHFSRAQKSLVPSESLALLRCCLCDDDLYRFRSGQLLSNFRYVKTLRFSSFHHLVSPDGFLHILRTFDPLHLCCAFQEFLDKDGNNVSHLRRHFDLELLDTLSNRFKASSICQFLHTSTQGNWLNKCLIVQLKSFFGDCDFSMSWFCKALGTFETSLEISSIESFNQRRSGWNGFLVDLWIIDQDDAPGNEDSLFFWENFEANNIGKH